MSEKPLGSWTTGQLIAEIRALREALTPFAECEPLGYSTQYDGQPIPQSYSVTTKKALHAWHFAQVRRLVPSVPATTISKEPT